MSDRLVPETQEAWLQGLNSWTLCLTASQPCTYCMHSLDLPWKPHLGQTLPSWCCWWGRACLLLFTRKVFLNSSSIRPSGSGSHLVYPEWSNKVTEWWTRLGSLSSLGEEENMLFMCFPWFSGRMTTIIDTIGHVVLTSYSGKSALGFISWSLQHCRSWPCSILYVRKSLTEELANVSKLKWRNWF